MLHRGSASQQRGAPNGLTGAIRSARRNSRVTDQPDKPIEGDVEVDVDKTNSSSFEQLPRERSEEFEGLGDAEWVLEDGTLRFAGSFDHKGVSP